MSDYIHNPDMFMPVLLSLLIAGSPPTPPLAKSSTPVRVATFNTSLYSDTDGGLRARLQAGDEKARQIAAIIQHRRPDILLLNEFDYDEGAVAAGIFQRDYLEVGQFGQPPIRYPYRYLAAVNTGEPTGLDLDRDGRVAGGNDAFGFGAHRGQYGMLVLSRFPIVTAGVRTFRTLPWHRMPGALQPIDPQTQAPWYPRDAWLKLRLSSKSHWDVPVETSEGVLHFLVDHPTPPVFDGAEDRNGRRNFDEIRLWAEYISSAPNPWLCDDHGRCGSLPEGERFVIAGDQNADPVDGDSMPGAIGQLLEHPRVLKVAAPRSEGALASTRKVGDGNVAHRGPASEDTGEFGTRLGNLRLDYLIPSLGLSVQGSGVFWPKPGQTGSEWISASDHHLVWMDVTLDDRREPARPGTTTESAPGAGLAAPRSTSSATRPP